MAISQFFDIPTWELTLDQVILDREDGKWNFYVMKNGSKVAVVIAKSATGNKYLKTVEDSE